MLNQSHSRLKKINYSRNFALHVDPCSGFSSCSCAHEACHDNPTVLDGHRFRAHDLPLSGGDVELLDADNADHILAHEQENVKEAGMGDYRAVHYKEVLGLACIGLALVHLAP